MEARIASLHIYPLKSARGIAVDSAQVEASGFPLDRHWMLVDEGGRFLSQRRNPRMALLTTRLTNDHLQVGFPETEPLLISVDTPSGEPSPATMHRADERIRVLDEGADATTWFTETVGDGTPLRLVRIAPDFVRHIPDGIPGAVELADAYPYLVASNASLALLNDQLIARGIPQAPLAMERFRPNIVLDLAEPWVEMNAGSRLRTEGGAVELQLVKPCQRCTIPQVDPSTGERDLGSDLHRALTQLSARTADPGNHFGQNGVLRSGDGSTLRVGQKLVLQHNR